MSLVGRTKVEKWMGFYEFFRPPKVRAVGKSFLLQGLFVCHVGGRKESLFLNFPGVRDNEIGDIY